MLRLLYVLNIYQWGNRFEHLKTPTQIIFLSLNVYLNRMSLCLCRETEILFKPSLKYLVSVSESFALLNAVLRSEKSLKISKGKLFLNRLKNESFRHVFDMK